MFYRWFQLWRALSGRITPAECAAVHDMLSPAEYALFASMAPFDQRHTLDVCQTLQRDGVTDRSLLVAALLHDCGKVNERGQPIPLVYYGVFVVLRKLAPHLYRRAATSQRSFLWPFRTHAHHEQRSVARAIAAGSSAGVVTVLRDYAAGVPTPATRSLQSADDRN